MTRPPFVRFAGAIALGALLVASHAASGQSRNAFDVANLDRTSAPSGDFYHFAVGGWLRRNPIPADRSSWGSFDELEKRSELRVRAILESPDLSAATAGSEERKIGDYYAACMNVAAIERRGVASLRSRLAAIAALRDKRRLAPLVADAGAIASGYAGGGVMFAFASEQDPKNVTNVIGGLSQGGTLLPTRDYYLAADKRSVEIRAAYRAYLVETFALLGDVPSRAAVEAGNVLALETALARGSKAPADLRDPFANYHPMPLAAVARIGPHFDWAGYFSAIGVGPGGTARIDVGQPAFVAALDRAIATQSLDAWKSYLRLHVVASAGESLPRAFRNASFAFFGKNLYGVAAMPPRWRTCANATGDGLGFAVGKAYVKRYFSAAARARARAEIAAIKVQLHDDIETLPWMGPQSRAAALAKLAKLSTAKVGYPDRWRDYGRLTVAPSDYGADKLAAARFAFARDVAKIGRPLDRSEWGMTPQTVNAYYDPTMNEVVIPAAILQEPFFDEKADDAINFGGIGAVIGHEMTHGFDDQGSNYDGDGNLRPWMSPTDAKRFAQRVGCVIAQANAFEAIPGLKLNGKLVAGEATADIGGTTLAFRALQASLHGKRPPPIDGFTAQQRFYLSWAQVWRSNDRPQSLRAQVLGDPHPTSPYRVNATLSDEAGFAAAFATKPGDAMYLAPAARCTIW